MGIRAGFFSILIILFFFTSGLPAYSQIPESIKSLCHSDRELKIKIISGRNLPEINDLEKDPQCAKIVVIQMMPEQMTSEMAQKLLNWVNNGGTLWFYDSRMASFLGMEASSVSREGIMHEKISGEYGDVKKYPGIATLAQAYGEHPVVTGVTGVVVFLLEVGKDSYGAVRITPGVKPLLKLDLTKDVAVSAIKETGKGMVIFKTLLWQNQVDGARFQANIKEFSAGFPIPKITTKQSKITDEMLLAKSGSLNQDLTDVVVLSDGRSVRGRVSGDTLILEATDKTMKIPMNELKAIEIDVSSGIDKVIYKNEKEIKGFLALKGGIQFVVPNGAKVTLEKQDIKKIYFSKSKEAEERGRIDATENSRGTR